MTPNPKPSLRSLNFDTPPGLGVEAGQQGKVVRLSGQWTALALARDRARRRHAAAATRSAGNRPLGSARVERLDHVGGQALWRVWGRKMPADVALSDTQREIFERVALLDAEREEPEPVIKFDPFTRFGLPLFSFFEHLYGGLSHVRRLRARSDRLVRRPSAFRGPKSRRTSIAPAPRRWRSRRSSRS